MELFILVLAFALVGYLFGSSRLGKNADRAAERAALVSQSWAERLGSKWKSTFSGKSMSEGFRRWVSKQPAEAFPENERIWLNDLSDRELREFVKSLTEFGNGLGFNLNTLVEGGLDSQPRMRQVFVEAISVYSSAYRKARVARQEAQALDEPEAGQVEAGGGKEPGESALGRGKAEENQILEPASTD